MSDDDLRKVGDFTLMPCDPDVCQECGRDHEPTAPHDAQSLYYQYRFYADHDRWPTWTDALAHVEPELRAQWVEGLAVHGVIVAD